MQLQGVADSVGSSEDLPQPQDDQSDPVEDLGQCLHEERKERAKM